MPLETNEEIEKTLKEYNSFFSNDLRNILKLSLSIMENSVDSDTFLIATIQNYKSQINSLQSQNEQIIMSVSGQYILGLK
jgi:conjugal transfer/entry exclusion protein